MVSGCAWTPSASMCAATARRQLECIAKAGNGPYCDAPDAKAPARRLQRSAQLSADGYKQGDSTARADSEASAGAGWSPAATEVAASDTMKLVAAAGVGAGTVLGLGVWMLLVRRRPTAAPPDPVPFPAQGQAQGQVPGPVAGQAPGEVPGQGQGHGQAPGQYGPPPAW